MRLLRTNWSDTMPHILLDEYGNEQRDENGNIKMVEDYKEAKVIYIDAISYADDEEIEAEIEFKGKIYRGFLH